jgi:hypothetical protein
MFEGRKNSWLCHALLLVALAAGAIMTQFVPTYQNMAARIEAARPVSTSKASNNSSSHVSRIELDLRQLAMLTSII